MNKPDFMALSLRVLEEQTDISNVSWSNYFTGHKSPTLTTLEIVSDKLEIPLGEFTEWFRERRDNTIRKRTRKIVEQSRRNTA